MTRLIRVPLLIPTWAAAQVLFPNMIFVRWDVHASRRLIAHELVHVEQIERYGLLGYWFRYVALLVMYGYDEHPMENEARALESTTVWLERAATVLEVSDA